MRALRVPRRAAPAPAPLSRPVAHVSASVVRAREEERARLGRELHDDIGQTLTLLLVRLRVAEGITAEPAVRTELAELRTLVASALDSVHRLSHDLGPGVLDELGLAGGLSWLVERVRADTGLEVALEVALADERVAPETALAFYRVTQEALTNVVRHAGAKTATVRLSASGDGLALVVCDTGSGFVPARLRGDGIRGMRERLAQVRGTLRIDSAPGSGTTVIATAPLEAT